MLQRTIRDWVDTLGTVTKIDDPKAFFNYQVEKKETSCVLNVARPKGLLKTIVVLSSLSLSGGHVTRFEALSEESRRVLLAELKIEVSRLSMGWAGFAAPLSKMQVLEQIPITPELTEHQFGVAIQKVINATILVRQVIQLKLGSGAASDAEPQRTATQIQSGGGGQTIPPG